MIFFFLINIFQIKFHKIIHHCDANRSNFNLEENFLYDYVISCPSKLPQIISLSNDVSPRSLYISDKSNVHIACSPQNKKAEITKFYIYDEPYITFENDCNISFIEIFGSPIFKSSKNATIYFNNVVLHNNSYQLPFKPQNVIYSQNNIKKHTKSNYHKCDCLTYELSNYVNIICSFNSSI